MQVMVKNYPTPNPRRLERYHEWAAKSKRSFNKPAVVTDSAVKGWLTNFPELTTRSVLLEELKVNGVLRRKLFNMLGQIVSLRKLPKNVKSYAIQSLSFVVVDQLGDYLSAVDKIVISEARAVTKNLMKNLLGLKTSVWDVEVLRGDSV